MEFRRAFTIVELLIVIVVIAIIAVISIVAYSNTTQKATISSIQADLTNAKKQLLAFQASSTTNSFPTAINCNSPSATEICIKSSSNGSTYGYTVNNSTSPAYFILTITNGASKYWINSGGSISTSPNIVTDGLVLYLDSANPDSYPGNGTTWYDLSGNSNNATLLNGVRFSTDNGGVMNFTATSNMYASVPSFNLLTPLTISVWFNKTLNQNWTSLLDRYGSESLDSLSFGFDSGAGTRLSYMWNNTAPWSNTVLSNATINNGSWYNASVASASGSTLFYINNSLDSTRTTSEVANSGPYIIGANLPGGDEYYTGRISTILVYNKSLSQAELTQNYNALKDRYGL